MSFSLILNLVLVALTPHQAAFAQDQYRENMTVNNIYNQVEVSSKVNVELTEFVMQDIEFMVLSWKTPSADQNELNNWLAATESRLKTLRVIALESKLDPFVVESIDEVAGIVTTYTNYLNTLRSYKYSDAVVIVEGDRTPASIAVRTVGTMTSTWLSAGGPAGHIPAITMGVAAGVGEVFMVGGASLERASKLSKLADIHKTESAKLIRDTEVVFSRRVRYLKNFATKLAERHPEIKVPSFERAVGIEKINLGHTNSPFPYVEKAYQLVNTDRIGAARAFAKAAKMVPLSVGVYAQDYTAPYQLLAGHLLEFESRIRGESKLAEEAVLQFKAAIWTLGGDLSSVSYPYLIAYARALAASGQNTNALEVARYISSKIPSGSLIKAACSYDLATVYSLLGDQSAALRYLRDSYRAKPRRDPQALKDPLLASLISKYPSAVERVVHNPLVGAWRLLGSGEYHFYVDESFMQKRHLVRAFGVSSKLGFFNRTTGKWTVVGDSTLRLFDRKDDLDFEFKLSVNGNVLTLTTKDNVTEKWKRDGPSGLLDQESGATSLSGRKLYPNGGWVWSDGSKPTFARFTTSRTHSEPNNLYWYTYEDPLVGRVDQLFFQER